MHKTIKRNSIKFFAVFLFSIGIFICSINMVYFIGNTGNIHNSQGKNEGQSQNTPNDSADPITSDDVKLWKRIGSTWVKQDGTPTIKRGIETINITYNNTGNGYIYGVDVDIFKANITLYGGSVQFNISLVSIGSEIYTANFTPSILNTTGIASITVLAVKGLNIINTPLSIDRNINILNNLPILGVKLNTTEVYRGKNLFLNFTPSDIEDSVLQLTWKVTLLNPNNVLNQTIVNLNHVFSYNLSVPLGALVGTWRINATCWDSTTASQSVYYPFKVLNTNPLITQWQFKVNGQIKSGSSIDVRRVTDVFTVSLNVTDPDDKYNLLMKLEAKDPKTGQAILLPVNTYSTIGAVNQESGTFQKNFTIPASVALGIVTLKITIYEASNASNYHQLTQDLKIVNNLPEIKKIKINGKSGERFNFHTNDKINFTFSLFDVEKSIKYVRILLYHEEKDTYYNYSTMYFDNNTFISIRAVDVPSGDYYVYLYVIDDSEESVQSIPIAINISIEEEINPYVWLLFVVGIIVGACISLGIAIWRIKSKAVKGKSKDIDDSEDEIEEEESKEKSKIKSVKETESKITEKETTKQKAKEKDKSDDKSQKKEEKTETTSKTSSGPQKKLIRKL